MLWVGTDDGNLWVTRNGGANWTDVTANVGLPHRSTREAIALAIQLIAHVSRVDGRRRVTELVEVVGYDGASDRFLLEPRVGRILPMEGVVP